MFVRMHVYSRINAAELECSMRECALRKTDAKFAYGTNIFTISKHIIVRHILAAPFFPVLALHPSVLPPPPMQFRRPCAYPKRRPDDFIHAAIGCTLSGWKSQTGPPSAADGCIRTCARVLRAVPARLMLTSRARLRRRFVICTVQILYSSSIIAGMQPIEMRSGACLVIFRGLCLLDCMNDGLVLVKFISTELKIVRNNHA